MRRFRSTGRFSNRLNLFREAVGASTVRKRLRAESRHTQAYCHAVLVDALENRVLLSTLPAATTTFDQNITGPTALLSDVNYSSPSISYDPNNPLNVVEASVKDNPNAAGTQKVFIQLSYSTNGGTSWTDISGMVPGNDTDPLNSTNNSTIPYSEATDVTVGFDLNENFYITYSEHDASNNSGAIVLQQYEFNSGAPSIDATNQNVVVYQWAGADYAYTPTMAVDTNQASFTDPRSGDTQGDPYSGNIYVAWATDDTAPTSANGFQPDRAVLAVATPGSQSGSDPGAIRFSPPMTVNTANQYQGNTGGEVSTPKIVISQGDISGAITPGQVDVVWNNISNNTIQSSPANGGVSGADYTFPLTGAAVQNADAQLFSYYDALTPGPNPEPATFDPTNPYAVPTEAYPPAAGTVANSGDQVSFLEADFNNDNIEDLAILDKTTGTVDVYLGVGDGELVGDVQLTGLTNPKAIVAGDFNGDGDEDLLVVDSNGLEVFTGDGQGNFTWSNNGQPWTVTGPTPDFTDNATWNIQSAKINSDALSDIALTDSKSNSLYVATSAYTPASNTQIPIDTLATALANGQTNITTLHLEIPLANAIPNGSTITLVSGGNTQTLTLNSAASAGDTTLIVASFTANAAYGIGTTVQGPTPPSDAFNFVSYTLTGTNPQSLSLQDVNGDNKVDAIVGDGDTLGHVEVFSGSLLTATDMAYPVGAPITQVLVADVNGDNKADITALTSRGVSVLRNTGTSFALSATNPAIAETGIVSGVYGAVESSTATDLVVINSAGYLQVLKPVVAGTSISFTNATTINFPTDNGTPDPTAIINYPNDAAARFDLFVFNDDTGDVVDYNVPEVQGTVAVGTDFDLNVNITDPNFVVSNVALDLAVTDADLDQVAAELIGPDGTAYWLFLNQDIGTAPNSAVPVWSTQDTILGTTINDTLAQGIANPSGTPGIGYVSSSGDQLDAQIDDQAARPINDPNVSNFVADFRQEENLPSQQVAAMTYWGLPADSLEALDGQLANPTTGPSAVNGQWILRFFTFEDFTAPVVQTLDNATLVFTGSTVPQATPAPLGLIPEGDPNKVAATSIAGTLSNTGFNLKTANNPDGIGPGISVAEDNSLGIYSPYQGRIYVAYTNLTNGDTNIDLAYSDDGGATWNASNSTPVNSDTTNSQFSPAIAVDQATGTLVLTWYDASADAANARVAREITTSTDGGDTFNTQSYLNVSNDVYDAITGAAVNLGPIPDNISSGSAYNGSTGNNYSGFGGSEGLAVIDGHVYAVWAGNQNGGPTGKNAMDILTSTTTFADGPRVLSSTEGVVSTPEDILNPSVDNSPVLQYIDVTFDRPIVPAVGITYDPTDPTDFPYYFDPSAITIYYRNDSTPGTSPPTSILPEGDILSIEPLDYGFVGNGLADPNDLYGEATAFRIAIAPQAAAGTYSYSISDPIIAGSHTIADGYIYTGMGNFQAPYSISATGSDIAASTIGGDTNLPVPAPGSTSQYSYITIPASLPTVYVGGTIVNINVTVDLDGASDALSALSLFLIDPNGNEIPLSLDRVGASETIADVGTNSSIGGNGFISTVFDDQATTPVAFGNYQFSGTFKPDTSDGVVDAADGGAQGLGSFNGDTLNVGDEWTLEIDSTRTNNGVNPIGLLRDWSLQFTTGTLGTYVGNPMDQNGDAIAGEAPQAQATNLGGPATAPGTLGDDYITPNPTSNNAYTLNAGGNYFAAPYDDSTLPLMIPGPQVLTTRNYPATVSNGSIPAAAGANTPGTFSNTITIGGDSDVDISQLMVDLNLTSAGSVGSLVVQLIYTPAGGGPSESIPVTLTDEVAGGGSSFGGTAGGEFVPTIFTDDASSSIQLNTNTSPYEGFYQPATALSALDGQSLDGTFELQIRNFDTGSTATLNGWSITASTSITATDPNDGAGLNSVEVYFSQPMNPTTVENATVTLTGPDGPISGPFTITADPNYDANYVDGDNRTYEITFPSALNLTGGYSLVLGTPGAEPASVAGTLLDSDSNDGLEMLRDESSSSATQTVTQTVTGLSTPISKFNGTDGIVQSMQTVSPEFLITGATVTLQLSYPRATELSVTLIAPDGTAIQLFSNLSSTGKLLSGDSIVFTDTASVTIASGSAPFLGTFSPQDPLSYLNGLLSSGTWTLQIKDNGANSGTLVGWSLKLTGTNPDSGAGVEPGDSATIGFNVFNMGADNPQSHETWNPVGGASDAAGATSASGPVTAIAVDPSDPSGNTVYVGAATGGVWKTTDFLTTDPNGPTYVPLTNFLGTDTSNIGSIAVLGSQVNPASSLTVPSMIFAATGELSDTATGAADNAPGAGILVSLDGGNTWTVSDDGGKFDGMIAAKIIVDPNLQSNGHAIVYVAFNDPTAASSPGNGGVYVSTDSGSTWTLLRAGAASDIVFEQNSGINVFQQGVSNPTHNLNDLVAAFIGEGVFLSTNRGATWSELLGNLGDPLIVNGTTPVSVTSGGSPNGNNGRIVLATPDLTGNPVQDLLYQGWIYAAVVSSGYPDFSGSILGLYMTKDYGQTWTKVSINYDVAEGSTIPNGTGNYAVALTVDPVDPNVVYLASSGYANAGDGLIRIDTTGISDPESFYMGETANDGGALRIDTTDTASSPTNNGPYANPIEQPTINLIQNPSQPFVTNATIDVSDITRFNNTGTGGSWIPFDDAFDFTNTTNPIPTASYYHVLVTDIDPLTGLSRLIAGTEQGVYSGLDDNGTYVTNDPDNQEPLGATTDTSFSETPIGSRNGNLQIAEFYYGAVQPSQDAADDAGALFYGNANGLGLTSSTADVLTTGNTSWTATDVPSIGYGVATDPTGSGALYQYNDPGPSGTFTNFFEVNGVGRTNGLINATDTAFTSEDPEWPDLGASGNGSIGYNFAVNPLNGDQIVISSNTGQVYATQNQGETWSLISPANGLDGANATALAYGAPANQVTNGTFIYAGTIAGRMYVTFNGGGGNGQTWYDITPPNTGGGNYVESIEPDPTPGSYDVYAITKTGVYYLSNAEEAATNTKDPVTGKVPTWTAITSNLATVTGTPTVGVNSLTTMTADWRYATPILYVGAENGVYRGIDNTTTGTWQWTLFPNMATDSAPVDGGDLPDVQITDLDLATGDVNPTTGLPDTAPGDPDALVASTFGRGAYAIRLAPIVASTAATVPSTLPFDKIINTSAGATTSYITNATTLTISGTSEKAITGYNQALISIYRLNADGSLYIDPNTSQPVLLGGYEPGDNNNSADPNSSNNPANIANANGNFSITTTVALPSVNGNYYVGIEATDNAGVVGAFSMVTVALEVTPPAVSSLALTAASDSGVSSTDGLTNIKTPTIVGQGAAGATVTLMVTNSSDVTQTFTGIAADSGGQFTKTLPTLADGIYTVTASEVDALGNQGSTSAPYQFTVLTTIATPTAPALPANVTYDTGSSQTDGITSNNLPIFTGTGPADLIGANNSVTVTITPASGTPIVLAPVMADGSGNYTTGTPTTALADGTYTVTVQQTDAAGNVSLASPATTLVIDTTAPIVQAASFTASQFGSFNGTVANFQDINAAAGTATIDWGDGSGDTAGTIKYVSGDNWIVTGSYAYQTQGPETVTVTVTDTAGNVSTPSMVNIMVGAPAIIVSAPGIYIAAGKPFDSVVATFNSGVLVDGDADTNFTVENIDWGDGTTSSSTDGNNDVSIVPENPSDPTDTTFLVIASHAYSDAVHNYPVSITIDSTDAMATEGVASTTAYVENGAQLVDVQSKPVSVNEGDSTTPLDVADIANGVYLSDDDFATDFTSADFTATVHWGDGTSSSTSDSNGDLTIVADGSGGFFVEGTHAYADGTAAGTPETITTSVKVDGVSTSPASVTGTATVANVIPTVTSVAGTNFALVNQQVSFTLNTTDPGSTDATHGFIYSIDWGDGSGLQTINATANNGVNFAVKHTYTAGGNFTISVTATDKDGGVSLATSNSMLNVQVAQLVAEPSFTVNEGTTLTNYPVAYITGASSLPTFGSISINWGDGTTDLSTNSGSNISIVADPGGSGNYLIEDTHTYADGDAAGTNYTIATGVIPTGASSPVTVQETATVDNVAPTLAATIPSQAIAGETINVPLMVTDPGITDTSTGFTYSIDWGDGTMQTIPAAANNGSDNPPHAYAAGGSYNVTITATDKDGAVSNSVQSTIQVAGLTGTTIAASEGTPFSGVVATITNAAGFNPVQFTATINWGDGTNTAGTIASNGDGTFSITGAHTYADGPATHNVVATVTFGSSSGQVTSTATVANIPPTASITGPTFALAGQSVSFAIGATDPGTVDLSDGFAYSINFGDGTSQTIAASIGDNTGQTVTHTYSSSGAFTVSVTATDKDGATSPAATQTIAIAGVNIVALADLPEGSTFTGTIATINDASAYGTNSFTASINWGDGTTTAGNITIDPNNAGTFDIAGSHLYGDGPANYTVTVTITSTSGLQTTSAAGTIKIDNVPPTLSVTGPVGGFINQTLVLGLSATDPSAADTAAGFTYQINWGDGSAQTIAATPNDGTGQSLSHTYSTLGNYSVSVTATDKDGGVSTTQVHAFDIVQNPQIESFAATATGITFTLPQTTAPVSSLDASDFVLIKDGSQNISLTGAPITFDPATGAVSIDTTSLNLGAGDYQLYTLPGTNITPALFTLGIDESALITKTVKLTPGKKAKAASIHFKNFNIGSAPEAPAVLILQNVSTTQPLTLSQFAFLSSGPFSFALQGQTYGQTQYTIAPGGTLTVRVYYTPTVAGSSKTRLRAEFNNGQALDYGAVVGNFSGKAVIPKVKSSRITKKILKDEK